MMKINYWKIIEIVAIAMIVFSATLAIQAYYNVGYKECISDPLVYASIMYEEQTGYRFIGTGNFLPNEKPLNAPTLFFSSYGVEVTKPSGEISNSSNFTFTFD